MDGRKEREGERIYSTMADHPCSSIIIRSPSNTRFIFRPTLFVSYCNWDLRPCRASALPLYVYVCGGNPALLLPDVVRCRPRTTGLRARRSKYGNLGTHDWQPHHTSSLSQSGPSRPRATNYVIQRARGGVLSHRALQL